MFRIYLLSAIRTLVKNRGIAIINISGLAIGLTAFLFIVHYLFYEISFDSFFRDSKLIYRVNMDILNGGEIFYHGTKTSRGLYKTCIKEVPGIEANTDAFFEACLVRYKDAQLSQQRILWVDEGFEKVFSLKMISGKTDFARPLTGIIARSIVPGLFGNEDPVGKIVKLNEGMLIEITGVFEDLPSNTHLTGDFFISLMTWENFRWIRSAPDWTYNAFWNYIKLEPGVNKEVMEKTLTDLANSNTPRRANERTIKMFLQPVSDLHYLRGLEGEMGSQTNQKSLMFLLAIGLLTVLIAWINYVNLTTALSAKRADEIGVRKLIGASAFNIWIQSFIETVILNLLALILSFIIYHFLLRSFAAYFNIPLSQAEFPEKYIVLSLLSISFTGILISSIYNTLKLNKFDPFSGKKSIQNKKVIQKGMVIIQLAISIIFIVITMSVYKQISFMKNMDMGINFDRVITINGPASLNSDTARRSRYVAFRRDLMQYPEFKSATANSFTPGEAPRYGYVEYVRPDAGIRPDILFFENTADDKLVETFELNLLAGTGFSPVASQNTRKVLINMKSANALGFKTPKEAVGRFIYRPNRDTIPIEIIGVLADFHNEGLQKPLYPIIYNNRHPFEFGYYSIKLNTINVNKALERLKIIWAENYPADPMDYFFADEYFFRQYLSEARFGKFYTLLTILSISIACMGLYGLIIFYLNQKRSEISIRKINGARFIDVMIMLNKDFVRWVIIAFIIALPCAWYIVQKWLQNFAYKTQLSWWIFVLAGMSTLVISLFTVSWHVWKAAARNPVEALKYE